MFEKMKERIREKRAEKTMSSEQKSASHGREKSLKILGKDGILTGTWTEINLPLGQNDYDSYDRFIIKDGIINGQKVSGSFTIIEHLKTDNAPSYKESDLYINSRHLSQEEGEEFVKKFGGVALDKRVEERASNSVKHIESQMKDGESNKSDE
jgi:hypothetical protein